MAGSTDEAGGCDTEYIEGRGTGDEGRRMSDIGTVYKRRGENTIQTAEIEKALKIKEECKDEKR